ncbi:hypothetical protein [Mycoplasma sp. ATU-Cv-508]|uniref:hypothetical protein n=1 Tax=Mycoplasma sp. ATU-Cv-508 TaxID=2048001 RepID=UPI000FDE1BDB
MKSEFSGFSKTAPRIGYVYPSKEVVSVKKQFQDKKSVWHFFRSFNAYLKNQTIVSLKIAYQSNGLIVFRGRSNRGRFIVLVNISRERKEWGHGTAENMAQSCFRVIRTETTQSVQSDWTLLKACFTY